MARGGSKRRTYVRDANGRFASTPGGGSKSLAAARKAARSTGGAKGTLVARTSLKASRAKLRAKDPADPTIRNTLSTRAQKGAVTRGNQSLRAAKVASQRTAVGRSGVGTISKKRTPVMKATVLGGDKRIPAIDRPGSMANTLRQTMQALAKADAQRIREIESITGQKVRAPRRAPAGEGATARAPGRRSVSGTLGDNLKKLAQSDARMMRGIGEIVRDATPKVGDRKGRTSIGGGKKALSPAASKPPAPKPPSRAKGSRTRLPGMGGVVAKPKGLKPGVLPQKEKRIVGKPLGGESKKAASAPIKRPGTMKPPITLSRLKEIGGNRWQKNNMDRVYFNNLASRAGMDYSRYKSSGRVSSAALKGKGISNSKAGEIINNLNAGKVYFDRKTRKMVAQEPYMPSGRSRQQTTAKGLLNEVARKLERQGRIRTVKRANQKRKSK